MHKFLDIDPKIIRIIKDLQEAGFESYIVGGAVRDLLLGQTPKDYDLSTAATPEEICRVFGRRHTMIIGKRFRLVHYRIGREIIEISTFRRSPGKNLSANNPKFAAVPSKMIFDDNNFGSAEEDAFRRDFTVNALFYDPIREEILDYTGHGVDDINNKIVRVIGEPDVRFEEDPVRMLRALKLVARFDFSIDNAAENSIFANMDKIRHVPISRMTLELEKVLSSGYVNNMLEAFHDYGLLNYFLPFFAENWNSPEMEQALDYVYERDCQVCSGCLRNSISLVMACLTLPFIIKAVNDDRCRISAASSDIINRAFKPQTMVKRLLFAAEKTVNIYMTDKKPRRSQTHVSSYKHALELKEIVNIAQKAQM